ncbi:amidohydrolase family protein [Sediminibacterium soli]|uniref:amidohydrolase family protein n=1 Tax=Sediminibacterium soli TaxID=2698829 RepID=UPI00137B195F|nr:amidohydrolase family protein [Sediminibacterium soli]NCI47901.1 amidohydrolase family protein [Sediminibacterium soli]
MKKIISSILCLTVAASLLHAQETVYPTREFTGRLYITNGTVHVGNGTVVENATIEVNNGKIINVAAGITPAADAKVVDAKGKHVYPGLILPATDLGLKEIGAGVRASNDFSELGDYNSNIRAITAYNTDSRVINIIRANGILLASITPEGGVISGSSSVVQLDAWNWEDAAYKMDAGIHVNMPSFINRFGRRGGFPGFPGGFGAAQPADPARAALERIEEIKAFFREAKAYRQEGTHTSKNLKLEAVKGLFDKSQKLFVHGDQVKQMLVAIDFAKEFGFDVVIVGGSESYQIADLLKANNIAVILHESHALPASEDDDIDQPFKTPATLQKAGVLFALNDTNEETRYRNLSYNAGTAATYGLSREEALQSITLNPAKILGIADRTGSLEAGKDANIVVSDGDLLDMRTSHVSHAFIQGREVSLDNKQQQLYERYRFKYSIK